MIRKVGKFKLGWRWIYLYTDSELSGGLFQYTPKDDETAKMVVGLNSARYSQTFESLIHEAFEAVLNDMELVYCNYGHYSWDTGSRWMWMDHERFSEACSRVAEFILETEKEIKQAWMHNSKEKRVPRKKKRAR